MASIFTPQHLDQVVKKIWEDTEDRKKGSFKRALWYGNNSKIFGQNKGVRKLIRNTPRKAISFGIGKIPVLGDALGFVADSALDLGKNTYSDHIKHRIRAKPVSSVEKARKNVKKEVKDLKSNAVNVIDRNLVKLKDARNAVKPKLDEFMRYNATETVDLEERTKKAEALIRQLFEAYYYENKILGLTSKLREATEMIDEDIKKLNAATLETYWEVTELLLNDFE